MFDLTALLSNLGLGVASNAIYDAIKRYLSDDPRPTRDGLERTLQGVIRVYGQNVGASTIVDVLARSGAIVFQNSSVFAPHEISYVAATGARVSFGGTGRSETSKTAIESNGPRARVDIENNAAIRQKADGSIVFETGPDGTISFST
jgi:hypothetical protein